MQIERHHFLLDILKKQRRPKTTEELYLLINSDIQNISKSVSKRTIERDLAFLSTIYRQIEQHTEGRTNKWSWEPNEIKPISTTTEGASHLADETRVLQEVLRPLSFESRIAQHVLGFIGREWIFDSYGHWLVHQPESRLFWIKAGPGFGKTAITANIVHRKQSSVVATWFCDAKSIELKDPNKAITTIAFQLATHCEDYRAKLLDKLQLNANTPSEYRAEVWKDLDKKTRMTCF